MELKDYTKFINSKEFERAVYSNKLCLFLGAGVGQNIGMPTWNGLKCKITQWCFDNDIINHTQLMKLDEDKDCLKVISICENKLNNEQKELLNKKLLEIFHTDPLNNINDVYINLNKLYKENRALIIQTNYDTVIESLLTEQEGANKLFYIPYEHKEPLENISDLKNKIIYLHGRMAKDSSYENIVLTKNMYNQVYVLDNENKKERQKKFIELILSNYHIVFLGYSLQDIEIMQLIANKPDTDSHIDISVIIDDCDGKNTENKFLAEYFDIATNSAIKTYTYVTETKGFKAFSDVVQSITEKIESIHNKPKPIIEFQDPAKVDFDED